MAVPSVTSLSPTSGGAGTAVSVHGSGLSAVTGVSLGGAGAAFSISSDSLLVFTVPSGAAQGVDSPSLAWADTLIDPGGFAVTGGSVAPCDPACVSPQICVNGTCVTPTGPPPPSSSSDLLPYALAAGAAFAGLALLYQHRRQGATP